jgi:integrase
MAPRPTDRTVRELCETAIREGKLSDIPIAGQLGLYIRPSKSGRHSYRSLFWINGKRTGVVHGRVTLAQANKANADVRFDLARGIDPTEERRKQRETTERARADTLRAVAESYFARGGKHLRTLEQRRRTFERLIYPVLGGGTPIGEIKRRDIVRLLDHVEDRHGGRMADVVLAGVRRLLNWHATRDDSYVSVVVRGMNRHRASEHERERILSDDELRRVVLAAEQHSALYGAFVKFLLLTGARRGEVAGITESEITGSDWVLPASRNKVGRELLRPLSEPALAIVNDLPRYVGGRFLFTITGRHALANFSRVKREIDKASGVTGWTWHDLRRVSRSLMSRAGVSADVAEMLLGHVLPPMRRTYDRHAFHAEKAAGYAALARLLDTILHPPEDVNVVELELRRR